jgi:sensor histidine kinase YesM
MTLEPGITKQPYKRQLRNILIHKPLQKEYTLLMIGMMMAACLIVVMIIHFTMKQALLGNPYRIGSVSPYDLLSEVTQQLVMRVSLFLFFCIITATAVGVTFLHRVAGPVYRFRLLLKKLASGEIPSDMRLREKDYFKEVAMEFNNVFKVLRAKQILSEEMASVLDKLQNQALPKELESQVRQLRTELQRS